MNLNVNKAVKKQGIECARNIAEWLCLTQSPHLDSSSAAGRNSSGIYENGDERPANNWNLAFSIMGLLSAYQFFGCRRYEKAALNMARYLKTLQIFDPFHPEHYGAIRELTPQTPWCYTRDALSAAWGFIELYRHTETKEYLERARLWGEWFLKQGLDEDGWPLWGLKFDPYFEGREVQMRNDIQGSFQGGSLNFLYHLGKETNEEKWTGKIFVNMANHFITHIQQTSGFFASVERDIKKPSDPQNGLHRANDDLGTLGLLCAYKVTGDKRYLNSIEQFLQAVFEGQRKDGGFEDSVACIPVVLNTVYEAGGLIDVPSINPNSVETALKALYARQCNGRVNPRMRGGINEENKGFVCARSSCYALIVLLKFFAQSNKYLKV